MSATALEQLGAATAQAVRQVEVLAQRLSLRRRAFRQGLAEAAALNDAQPGLYQMDVGGAPFHTHTAVLHRHGSMLSAMASGDFTHDVEGGGCAFLDRDPMWFPLVLHFMRTGIALLPEDAEVRAAVFREARYYSLEGLCSAAEQSHERLFLAGSLQHSISTWKYEYENETSNPLQGSWERIDVRPRDMLSDCRFVAGDGCLFAVPSPIGHHAGSVSRFCPAAGAVKLIVCSSRLQKDKWQWQFASWAYGSGRLHATFEDRVQSLNVSTGQWEALPSLPTWLSQASPCVIDGRLFVIGGGTAYVEEYVAVERRWVSAPDMPREVEDVATVAFDGKLLVIGGYDICSEETLSAVLEYTPRDRSWKELPSLLTPRYSCAVAVLGGDVLVMGGQWFNGGEVEDITSVERYNRRSQCWEAMPSLTAALPLLAAAVVWV